MARRSRVAGVVASLAILLALPRSAYAYIDPGTTQSLFALIAPLVAILGAFLGYLLWPFRTLLTGLFHRRKASDGAAGAEPATGEPEQQTDTP